MYDKFTDFLNTIKPENAPLIEGIQEAFNIIFEATEDKVQEIDQKLASAPLASSNAVEPVATAEVPALEVPEESKTEELPKLELL